MLNYIPSYLLGWMRTQSRSAFIGDMLQAYHRHGGLTDRQLTEVKVRFIQAGNDIPAAPVRALRSLRGSFDPGYEGEGN